jgi:hypothetical protein
MEDTDMIKKEYMKPEMQTVELKHKCQILAGSVTSVTTTGLDDDLILPDEDKSGNPWENAW